MSTTNFKDLIVWQKAHLLVLNIYKLTCDFPKSETYGLTSQLRRSAISIVANIVEGYKKKSKLEKLRFFNISQRSLEETRYYLMLANDLDYYNTNVLINDIEEISRMLNSYCNAIIKSN